MNLRQILEMHGVSEHDIEEAVEQARQATRFVHSASGVLVEVLSRVAMRVEKEKPRAVIAKGAFLLQKVHEGSETLLKKR